MSAREGATIRPRLSDLVTDPERRRRYLADGRWNDDTLAARVAAHARERPEATAVIDPAGARRVDYGLLDRDAGRLAGHLRSLGVRAGDVVSVQLPNWYETVVVDLAILKLGAVLNPMLPIYRARELRHMLETGGVRVLFTPSVYRGTDHVEIVAALRPDLPRLEHHLVVEDPTVAPNAFGTWLDSLDHREPPLMPVDAASVSELLFTSGTESRPKAVMHTEQTATFSSRTTASSLGLTDADVVWAASPIGHSTGFNFGLRVALHHGLPLVLQDRWDAATAATLVEQHGITYAVAATTFVSDMVRQAEADSGPDLSSLRLFGSGGAAVPPEVVEAAARHGMNVLRLYGSTEALVATWNRPGDPAERRMRTDGPPLDQIEVQVRAEDGRAVVGEPGEILVRGPNTCVGFFDDPERTAATFAEDGWVRSGDLGVLDEDGYLTVVGRSKEIVIRGGLNIAPRELEELVGAHPAVAEVAVVGLPHPRLGEQACACVVVEPGATLELEELVAFLRQGGTAAYKLPEHLELVEELPRTSTGKVQKFKLVERIGERDAG